jgi:hypothetical protein
MNHENVIEGKMARRGKDEKSKRSSLASGQLGLKRTLFAKTTHSKNAETDHLSVLVHSLHEGVMCGFTHVPGSIAESDF